MELLQRCLTHLKWPITSFPRSVRQKCGPFSFERHYSRFIARTYQVASVVSVHTVPSVPFVLSTRCEHFSARQKKAVNAQQKLNCILQLHIEKLNVKNCCRSWRHSSRSELAVFFFSHCSQLLAHFSHWNWWVRWSRRMMRVYTKGIRKSFSCR